MTKKNKIHSLGNVRGIKNISKGKAKISKVQFNNYQKVSLANNSKAVMSMLVTTKKMHRIHVAKKITKKVALVPVKTSKKVIKTSYHGAKQGVKKGAVLAKDTAKESIKNEIEGYRETEVIFKATKEALSSANNARKGAKNLVKTVKHDYASKGKIRAGKREYSNLKKDYKALKKDLKISSKNEIVTTAKGVNRPTSLKDKKAELKIGKNEYKITKKSTLKENKSFKKGIKGKGKQKLSSTAKGTVKSIMINKIMGAGNSSDGENHTGETIGTIVTSLGKALLMKLLGLLGSLLASLIPLISTIIMPIIVVGAMVAFVAVLIGVIIAVVVNCTPLKWFITTDKSNPNIATQLWDDNFISLDKNLKNKYGYDCVNLDELNSYTNSTEIMMIYAAKYTEQMSDIESFSLNNADKSKYTEVFNQMVYSSETAGNTIISEGGLLGYSIVSTHYDCSSHLYPVSDSNYGSCIVDIRTDIPIYTVLSINGGLYQVVDRQDLAGDNSDLWTHPVIQICNDSAYDRGDYSSIDHKSASIPVYVAKLPESYHTGLRSHEEDRVRTTETDVIHTSGYWTEIEVLDGYTEVKWYDGLSQRELDYLDNWYPNLCLEGDPVLDDDFANWLKLLFPNYNRPQPQPITHIEQQWVDTGTTIEHIVTEEHYTETVWEPRNANDKDNEDTLVSVSKCVNVDFLTADEYIQKYGLTQDQLKWYQEILKYAGEDQTGSSIDELSATFTWLSYDTLFPAHNYKAKITSPYTKNRQDVAGQQGEAHLGVDFGMPEGTELYALSPGTVTFAGWENSNNHSQGYGYYVKITYTDGTSSLYGHMQSSKVKSGDRVDGNTLVGFSGNTGASTGAHLHFELIDSDNNKINTNQLANYWSSDIFDKE